MRKKMKRILSIFCTIALLASCTNEVMPDVDNGTNENLNLVAMEFSVSGEATRTALQADKSVHWEADDAISILDGTNNNEFTTTQSGASVTFTGEAEVAETYYAVYPYAEKNALAAEGTITLRFPHEQQASEAEAPSIHNVCVGVSDANQQFVMKNVGGLVYFSMNSSNITSVTLRGNNQEWIAGDATITFDELGVPSIAQTVTSSDVPTYIYDKITLTPEGETFTSGKTYYIAVPAGVTFEGGINLTFTNTDGLSATLTGSNPLTIGRSQTHNLQAIDTESLNWELQIPLEFVFYDYYAAGDVIYNNPFTDKATVGERSTLTTTVGGYNFYVLGANTASIKSARGQGYQVGKSADDYFELACPTGWSLYKVVIENGAWSGGTKGDIDLVDNNGTQVGETFEATTAQGKRHTWVIENPTETVYQLKHGADQQLTMRKLYLYYQKTSEVKQTIDISVDFTDMDVVNQFVGVTESATNITYDGYTYTLYTPAAGFTCRDTTKDGVTLSMGLYFNELKADMENYAYFGFPKIEGYHPTALTAKMARISSSAGGFDFEFAEIGAGTAVYSGSTPGAATYDTVELTFEEGSTSSDKHYCIRSKHYKTTLTSFTITYTED